MDALELTRELLRFNTINPPGDEEACATHLGRITSVPMPRSSALTSETIPEQPGG